MTLYKYESKYVIKPFRDLYIKSNGMVYANPSQEILMGLGYKPLVENECDLNYNQENECVVATYEEQGNEIIQGWEVQPRMEI